jgi:hypothetical protein
MLRSDRFARFPRDLHTFTMRRYIFRPRTAGFSGLIRILAPYPYTLRQQLGALMWKKASRMGFPATSPPGTIFRRLVGQRFTPGLTAFRGKIRPMAISGSELTARGPVLIPSKTSRYSSEDIHRVLFPDSPQPRTLEQLREGVRQYVKIRHARR